MQFKRWAVFRFSFACICFVAKGKCAEKRATEWGKKRQRKKQVAEGKGKWKQGDRRGRKRGWRGSKAEPHLSLFYRAALHRQRRHWCRAKQIYMAKRSWGELGEWRMQYGEWRMESCLAVASKAWWWRWRWRWWWPVAGVGEFGCRCRCTKWKMWLKTAIRNKLLFLLWAAVRVQSKLRAAVEAALPMQLEIESFRYQLQLLHLPSPSP